MTQFFSKTLDRAPQATTTHWDGDLVERHPNFGEVALSLLPASVILAAATALLVLV